MLTNAGFNVDFVGSRTTTQQPGLADPDHEGIQVIASIK